MSATIANASEMGAARVLIVEDDEDYANWIELALRDLGIRDIVKKYDGADALALTDVDPAFNLIICDWIMPNMNGIDFLRRYREKVSSSMFLLLTSKDGLEDAYEATQAGATNYIVKPVDIEELQTQIVRMLHFS